jgi:hypothetical protein
VHFNAYIRCNIHTDVPITIRARANKSANAITTQRIGVRGATAAAFAGFCCEVGALDIRFCFLSRAGLLRALTL